MTNIYRQYYTQLFLETVIQHSKEGILGQGFLGFCSILCIITLRESIILFGDSIPVLRGVNQGLLCFCQKAMSFEAAIW
jgi:hypothetical protein